MANSELVSGVRFLHPVGQSTLRQGLTIPRAAQDSWLGEIKKGQSLPVSILFGDGGSVVAVLRRLNNARGHLQFRYEASSQARLRDYLRKLFGEHPVRENAVLRIAEVAPRTFLFEPVSYGQRKLAVLSLYGPHFHNISAGGARGC